LPGVRTGVSDPGYSEADHPRHSRIVGRYETV
jgi:hypothetical protein